MMRKGADSLTSRCCGSGLCPPVKPGAPLPSFRVRHIRFIEAKESYEKDLGCHPLIALLARNVNNY